MLKREHIKQAIDAIARRDPEAGYFLDELLGDGAIDALPAERAVSETGDFLFLYETDVMTVRRFSFFNAGVVPIEQQLLIKYGEARKKQEITETGTALDYRKAAEEVRAAGIEFMLDHEIELAAARAGNRRPSRDEGRRRMIIDLLSRLKENRAGGRDHWAERALDAPASFVFKGVIANERPALFISFPLNRTALMQAVDLNLDFFHARALLDILVSSRRKRLFGCALDGRLAGLVFVRPREDLLSRSLEIRYIASARRTRHAPAGRPIRGVGSFLVAGVWLLGKTAFAPRHELILDSEIGALGFYRALGFSPRHSYSYVLKDPGSYLLDPIFAMAENTPGLPPDLMDEIGGHFRRSIRSARKSGSDGTDGGKPLVRAVRRALLSDRHPQLARSVLETLSAEGDSMPETAELIRIAGRFGGVSVSDRPEAAAHPIPVVHDPLFGEHLKALFHMESARRIQAVDEALSDPVLAGKWKPVRLRSISTEELAWVHTREHIERIAATAGKPVSSLDLDTQTTERSFEVACMAVGGVFNLLDEILNGRNRRGFAFVRPPGHHAEPGRAMGFCLFNNTALAAHYLERVYGLERIMIVDIDAHHGNGIQKAFYESDRVLYASLHQFPAYPGTGGAGEVGRGTGEGYTVNIPLPKGSRDFEFGEAIHGVVQPVARAFGPEIILVPCGFDLYRLDRLSEMNGTAEGYALMTHFLKQTADELCGGRLAYILEGGYSAPGLRDCASATMKELLDIPILDPRLIQRVVTADPNRNDTLRKVIDVQKKYWRAW